MNHALLIVFLNALLLAVGILTILISCLQYNNWFPVLTIVINLAAVFQLMLCGSCNGASDELFMGETDGRTVALQLSWFLFGLFALIGYAVPALLFRAQLVPDLALYFSWSGGTVVLVSMIIYLRLIWNRESSG